MNIHFLYSNKKIFNSHLGIVQYTCKIYDDDDDILK